MTVQSHDLAGAVPVPVSAGEPRPDRFDVLGVPVSAIDLPAAVRAIEGWIEARAKTYVCITGVHGVIECGKDAALQSIHEEAGLVTPDGMPLVWVAHLAGLPHVRRVYGPDLMRTLSARSGATGHRHFYFGGGDGIAEKLRSRLRSQHPDLSVVGTFTPPFRPSTPEEDEAIVRQINAAAPDILWVGLSTPKQERWMKSHRDRLDVPVMIGVGAAFDFLSGEKRQAPACMQRAGLEWLFRLVSEPRRLLRRYTSIVPLFLIRMALSLVENKVNRIRNSI